MLLITQENNTLVIQQKCKWQALFAKCSLSVCMLGLLPTIPAFFYQTHIFVAVLVSFNICLMEVLGIKAFFKISDTAIKMILTPHRVIDLDRKMCLLTPLGVNYITARECFGEDLVDQFNVQKVSFTFSDICIIEPDSENEHTLFLNKKSSCILAARSETNDLIPLLAASREECDKIYAAILLFSAYHTV